MILFFLLINFVFSSEVRVISLNPALTEILFEFDLDKNLVGTTTFSNYPEAAKNIPTVGTYLKPQIEKIVQLKPTHVLAFIEGNPEISEILKKANLNLIAFESRTIEDYPATVTKIGNLFNKKDRAEKIIDRWNKNWSQIQKININKKAIIQIDQNPLFVTGPDTFISKSLEKCGLHNGYKNITGYKTVSIESIGEIKPDLIVFIGQVNQPSEREQALNYWKQIPFTKNVLVTMGDADTLSRLGPRLPQAVLSFCQKIQKAL